jgi:hypothetical protein
MIPPTKKGVPIVSRTMRDVGFHGTIPFEILLSHSTPIILSLTTLCSVKRSDCSANAKQPRSRRIPTPC